jgi:hypothetical protein
MKPCEIYHVPFKESFLWKWRHHSPGGGLIESKESYRLYYECVSAALEQGYEPNIACFTPKPEERSHKPPAR